MKKTVLLIVLILAVVFGVITGCKKNPPSSPAASNTPNYTQTYESLFTATITPTRTMQAAASATATGVITFTRTATVTASFTVTTTSTVEDASTMTQTPTDTATPADTATATATMTATDCTPYTMGTGQSFIPTDGISSKVLEATKQTLPSTMKTSSLWIYCFNADFVRVGIYNDSGSLPSTLITQSASTAVVPGFNEIPLPSEVTLSAGAYWLAGVSSGSITMGVDSSSGNSTFDSAVMGTYGTMPDTFTPFNGTSFTSAVVIYGIFVCP